jgi:hypothetical protein
MKTTLLITLNAALLFLLVVLAVEGYAAPVFDDATYMTHGIAALGVASVALSLWFYAHPGNPAQSVQWLGYLSRTLVGLGLLGTVVGFIIAMHGVSAADAADVSAIAPMVGSLLSGMGTALSTTLVGSIAAEWVVLNRQFIAARG